MAREVEDEEKPSMRCYIRYLERGFSWVERGYGLVSGISG